MLLLGSEGQLGSDIQKRKPASWSLTTPMQKDLDLRDEAALLSFVVEAAFDLVINCAAYTAVDNAEADIDLAFAVNAKAPGVIAQACKEIDAKLIHVSTDYVFNGQASTPRKESDPTDPLGVYGKSKREGELAIQEQLGHSGATIARTAWLHGSAGDNFLKTMLRLAHEKEEIRVVDDQFGNPTWSGWLADVLIALVAIDPIGIVHATCKGTVSWLEFAREVIGTAKQYDAERFKAEVFAQSSSELKRAAPRPTYSALNCEKLESTLAVIEKSNVTRIPWQEGVKNHLKELGIG